MNIERKQCLMCKSLFTPYRPYQKYCSNECRDGAYKSWYKYKSKPTKEKKCLNCGKVFLSNDAKRKYCSSNCQLSINYKKKIPHELVCPICKKKFRTTSYIQRYCSKEHYLRAREIRNQEYGNQISRSK